MELGAGLEEAQPRQSLASRSIVNGRVAVTGKRKYLIESQVYPVRFALHLLKAHFPDVFKL